MIYQRLLKSRKLQSSLPCKFIIYKKFSVATDPGNISFPSKAQVVICGGGVLGSSVAYHLCELGWGQDTVIIEKGR